MSVGPLKQMIYDNDEELLETAEQVAFNYMQAKVSGTKP